MRCLPCITVSSVLPWCDLVSRPGSQSCARPRGSHLWPAAPLPICWQYGLEGQERTADVTNINWGLVTPITAHDCSAVEFTYERRRGRLQMAFHDHTDGWTTQMAGSHVRRARPIRISNWLPGGDRFVLYQCFLLVIPTVFHARHVVIVNTFYKEILHLIYHQTIVH